MAEFEYKTLSIDSKETEHSEKKAAALWIIIGVGALLIANHGIQFLFKGGRND